MTNQPVNNSTNHTAMPADPAGRGVDRLAASTSSPSSVSAVGSHASPAREWCLLARVLVAVLAAAEAVVWLAGGESPGRIDSSRLSFESAAAIGGLLLALLGVGLAVGTLRCGWRMVGDAACGLRAVPADGRAVTVAAAVCGILAADCGMWLHSAWLFAGLLVLLLLLGITRRQAQPVLGAPSAASGTERSRNAR